MAGTIALAGTPAGTNPNPADYTNRVQTLFNPKLLESLLLSLKLAKYGLSEGYSAIGDKIRFFRPRKANLDGITAQTITLNITPATTPSALTEGTTPTNMTVVGIGYVDISMGQRLGIATLSDRLQALDLFNTVKVYSKSMGEDAALDYDSVIRNSLVNGIYNSDATYAGLQGGYFERFAGVTPTGDSSTDFASMAALSNANAKLTRERALAVVTQLKTALIPKINGKYVGLVPSQAIHDLRQDTTWVQTGAYQAKEQLFKDGIIELDGVVYMEHDNPWIENTTYGSEWNGVEAVTANGLSYSCLFLGKDSFGIPNLNNKRAGGTQQAPKLEILNQADKSDPGNQKTILCWKALWGAGPFITTVNGERPRYIDLRVKSTFI